MPPFAQYIINCARMLCQEQREVGIIAEMYRRRIVEPERATTVVDLSCYPTPQAPRWQTDRPIILTMIQEETGSDLSSTLTFERYCQLHAQGRLVATYPVAGIHAGVVNLFPVPSEEVISLGHEPVMLKPNGTLTPISRAAWAMRFVENAMSDAWNGFAFLETLSFLHGACMSDMSTGPEGTFPVADALRSPEKDEHVVAIRGCVAQTRLELARRLFPPLDVLAAPNGTIVNKDAIAAYIELALETFERLYGIPKHPIELRFRRSVAEDIVQAHCLPTRLLYQIYWNALNSP